MLNNAANPITSPELSGTPTVIGDTEHSQASSPTVLSTKGLSLTEKISNLKVRIELDIMNSDHSNDDDPSAPPVINITKDGWHDASSRPPVFWVVKADFLYIFWVVEADFSYVFWVFQAIEAS